MKYAILFAFAGALFGALAFWRGGYFLILLWPALSCVAIGLAYFSFGPRVFGKRANGTFERVSYVLLLPYLAYVSCVWHVFRIVCREDCQNQVSDGLIIGRRLLAYELASDTEVVVDLTCEFIEPKFIRTSREYRSFPMLDGVAPAPQFIANIARELAKLNRHVYIHCAQGHGRTGLVAAAFLLAQGTATDPIAAIELLKSARPQVRFSRGQMACLESAFKLINEERNSRKLSDCQTS